MIGTFLAERGGKLRKLIISAQCPIGGRLMMLNPADVPMGREEIPQLNDIALWDAIYFRFNNA